MQALQPSCCTLSLSLSFSLCTSDSWPWHFSGAAPLDASCLPCRSRLSFPLPLPLCQETSSGAAATLDHDLGTHPQTPSLPTLQPVLSLSAAIRRATQQTLFLSAMQISSWPHCSSPERPFEPLSILKRTSASTAKLALISPESEDFQTLAIIDRQGHEVWSKGLHFKAGVKANDRWTSSKK